jgi:effector-binding domain-containing protein
VRERALGLLVGLSVLGSVAAVAAQQAPRQGPGPNQPASAEESDQPEVELKELAPVTVVYLEHQGPYWRMGHLFSQVAEFAARYEQAGPMFARYLDDPAQVDPQGLRAEVGFFANGPVDVSKPYLLAEWPARRVAALTVRGHYGRAPARYARVLEWINDHGYQAAGPITEVYLATGGAAAPADRVTEIRVPVAGEVAADIAAPQAVEAEPRPARPDELAAEGIGSLSSGDLQQLELRLQALRRAVLVTYPRQAAVTDTYLEPILAQPAWRDEEALAAPGYPAPGGQTGPGGEANVALIARLDALLVNVTLGRLEPGEVVEQVAELSGSVSEVLAAAPRGRLAHE